MASHGQWGRHLGRVALETAARATVRPALITTRSSRHVLWERGAEDRSHGPSSNVEPTVQLTGRSARCPTLDRSSRHAALATCLWGSQLLGTLSLSGNLRRAHDRSGQHAALATCLSASPLLGLLLCPAKLGLKALPERTAVPARSTRWFQFGSFRRSLLDR